VPDELPNLHLWWHPIDDRPDVDNDDSSSDKISDPRFLRSRFSYLCLTGILILTTKTISRSGGPQPGTVAGWQVYGGNSGAQGLARAAEHQADAILLDVMMPGMDGPTTFRELRKTQPLQHPRPAADGKVQSSDQRRFADLGVEGILFKPLPAALSNQISDPWAGADLHGRRRTNSASAALDRMWHVHLPELLERVDILELPRGLCRRPLSVDRSRLPWPQPNSWAGVLGLLDLPLGRYWPVN